MESSRDVVFTSCRAGTHRTHLVMQEDGEAWCGGELLHNTHFLTAFCHFAHKAAADRQMGGGASSKTPFSFCCDDVTNCVTITTEQSQSWVTGYSRTSRTTLIVKGTSCFSVCSVASLAVHLRHRLWTWSLGLTHWTWFPDLTLQTWSLDLVFGPGLWTWFFELCFLDLTRVCLSGPGVLGYLFII